MSAVSSVISARRWGEDVGMVSLLRKFYRQVRASREAQVRRPDEPPGRQKRLDQVVELRRAQHREASARLCSNVFGLELGPVIGEPVPVDAHDGHIEKVRAGASGGRGYPAGSLDLRLTGVPEGVRGGMDDHLASSDGRLHARATSDVALHRLHASG